MPKIGTLDALGDEMTLIWNILLTYSDNAKKTGSSIAARETGALAEFMMGRGGWILRL